MRHLIYCLSSPNFYLQHLDGTCLPACLFWSLSRLLAMVLVTQLRCTWPPDQPGHRAALSRRLASSSITLLDRTCMSTFRYVHVYNNWLRIIDLSHASSYSASQP